MKVVGRFVAAGQLVFAATEAAGLAVYLAGTRFAGFGWFWARRRCLFAFDTNYFLFMCFGFMSTSSEAFHSQLLPAESVG